MITNYLSDVNTPTLLEEQLKIEKKYQHRKVLNEGIAGKYYAINSHKAQRVSLCCSNLKFNIIENKITKEQRHILLKKLSHVCNDRFCPICNYRKKVSTFFKVKNGVEQFSKERDVQFLFLTLTVKNPELKNLRATIRHMNESFKRMMQRARVKKAFWGGFKVLEIFGKTTDTEKEAHPHFHVLLLAKKKYFVDHYISHPLWVRLWKEALRVDYDPVVDIRALKNRREKKQYLDEVLGDYTKDDLLKVTDKEVALYETMKYTVKYSIKEDEKIYNLSDEAFKILTEQLKGIRSYDIFGVLKSRVKLKEEERKEELKKEEGNWQLVLAVIYYFYEDAKKYKLKTAATIKNVNRLISVEDEKDITRRVNCPELFVDNFSLEKYLEELELEKVWDEWVYELGLPPPKQEQEELNLAVINLL